MMGKKLAPLGVLILMIIAIYWQFFLFGKIPIPSDTLVGAYYPWLDYKWGYITGVPVKNPPISDVFSQFFVWKYLAVDLIKQGIWPLWNPYSFSGTPLLATYHSAIFNPFNLLLLLPKYFGWGLYIFVQTLVAAIGMFLLLGKFINNNPAKIVGSLVFSLSGPMTTWVEFGTGVYAASMMPWIFYFLTIFYENQKIKYLAGLTLAFVILYFSGHAQLTIYSTILFFSYLLYKRKQFFLPILFWIVAVSISSIQFLPALNLTSASVRVDEAYSRTFNFGLNPWYEYIRLITADFFGNPTTYNYWGNISYHEQTSFLGTLSLPLIIPLFFKRFRSRELTFWLVIFLTSLFLALDTFITRLLYSLPLPFLTYSSASRIFFITTFSAGILVGLGLEKYINDSVYRKYATRATLILIITILIALLLVSFTQGSLSLNFKVSLRNSVLPLGLLASLLIIKNLKNYAVYIIFLLLFFDLARYFLKYNPFVNNHIVFPKTPLIEFLQNQPKPFRISRIDQEILPPNTWSHYGIESIEGYDPLGLEGYARYFNRLNGNSYSGGVGRYVEAKRFPNRFIDSLNAKYILAIKKEKLDKIDRGNFKKIFEEGQTVIYENQTALDRVYFIEKLIPVSSSDELVEDIDRSVFDPTKHAIILDYKGSLPGKIEKGKIENLQINPTEVKFTTVSQLPGFIVLANNFDEGWNLYINNNPTKLYQVNGALQGIMVQDGRNQIRLEYWPKSFDLGLKVSISSLAVFMLAIGYAFNKKIW